jgi:plastocyanin
MTRRRALVRLAVMAGTLGLAGAGLATAADRTDEIALTIEKNRFSPEEVKVKAGTPFVLVITNKDGAPEEFESKALRLEKVIPAGKTVKVSVRALKAGVYDFVGEYHEKTAKGRIVAE